MIVSSNERDMASEVVEDDDDITSKPQLVLAAKSRRIRYTSSPVISHHVSLSLLSSPDDSRRASVPFSWEEEPGKPKHHLRPLLPPPYSSTCLHLPPRLLLPAELTKKPLASSHGHLAWLQRWFRWNDERKDSEDTKKTTRPGGLDCLSFDVNKCYFWEVPWKKKKKKQLKNYGF